MTPGGVPGHTHRLPRAVLTTLVIICAGLLASIVLVSLVAVRANEQAEKTDQRLRALEEFIAQRGEERDQQYNTLDDRITRQICRLLDGLPAGPLLDPLRADNGCGPGIPPEELPPAARADLQSYATGPLAVDPTKTLSDYYAQPDPRFGRVTP